MHTLHILEFVSVRHHTNTHGTPINNLNLAEKI